MRCKSGFNKSNPGFTLIEILIAVSIIAIITAIALPSFTNMVAKSKLRSDVQTAQNVQNAVDMYIAEMGKTPLSTAQDSTRENATVVIQVLFNNGYLKKSTADMQTEDAFLAFYPDTRIVQVDIGVAKGLNKQVIDSISNTDLEFLANVPNPTDDSDTTSQ